jgi:hypothetical protein
MGFFDFLFGSRQAKRLDVQQDRIWMSQLAKFAGIARELSDRSASGSAAILLVAHFDETLEQLEPLAVAYKGDTSVTATLAEKLATDVAARLRLDETETIDLIVGERHPLPEVDARPYEFAAGLPCRCRLTHHLALDEPILKLFAGEGMRQMLSALGMSMSASIESPLVSRSVQKAQKKIASQATGNSAARSAAEWMEKNVPGAPE